MDKDKSPALGGGLLPPSGRYSLFSQPGSGFSGKPEPSGSFNLPPLGPSASASESGHFGIGVPSESNRFSQDISQMPDTPPKKLGHRRAHSEIVTLPDDISFDSDLGVVGGLDGPSLSDETEEDLFSMYLDMDKLYSSSATSAMQVGGSSSSVATAPGSSQAPALETPIAENSTSPVSEKPRVRHQHSQSMDGSTTIKPEMLTSGTDEPSAAESKKAISAAKLAELALIDPKRAKRIWANRQSAARSKERKMRYIAELERKVQTLQTEATSLSAQLTLLQRDTNGLTAENSELKLRLQTMEQQVHLQDALNDALKEEIQHLKVLTGQGMANGGPMMMNFGPSFGAGQQQFYPNNHAMHTLLTAHQLQQLQLHSQKPPFQQHQLRPFQLQQPPQQQPPPLQPQEQHLHQGGDSKLRSSMSASALTEHASDTCTSMKD
ncbi:PREDICTED: probable transcription factor PosF21 [Ipomoea nil]|uniref:probable transcription factor PosF21 n=1 Tax=Ipomoea nil TaxID=35883 RepID=UPI0009013157|nr:PREDICTED: probable transcription factor PosF21 [Ipomoea nil]